MVTVQNPVDFSGNQGVPDIPEAVFPSHPTFTMAADMLRKTFLNVHSLLPKAHKNSCESFSSAIDLSFVRASAHKNSGLLTSASQSEDIKIIRILNLANV